MLNRMLLPCYGGRVEVLIFRQGKGVTLLFMYSYETSVKNKFFKNSLRNNEK